MANTTLATFEDEDEDDNDDVDDEEKEYEEPCRFMGGKCDEGGGDEARLSSLQSGPKTRALITERLENFP